MFVAGSAIFDQPDYKKALGPEFVRGLRAALSGRLPWRIHKAEGGDSWIALKLGHDDLWLGCCFSDAHDTPRGRAIIISPPGNDPGHTQNNLHSKKNLSFKSVADAGKSILDHFKEFGGNGLI